ncbi:MAG: hypothetical protein GSR84_03935 [Desulfurococcales archaeon]|nr:hypothetical protein [Desulfurococcales archaeon]
MPAICTMCRRRPAVYVRTFSGDKLCQACLRRQLLKQAKRSLGSHGILKPRQRIVVPLSPLAPLPSLALADLASRVEARYGSTIIILINRDALEPGPGTLDKIKELGAEVAVESRPLPGGLSPPECMRAERALAITAAKRLGADAVAMPYTRDLLTLALLEAMAGQAEMLSEAEESWPGPVPGVAGLSRVESEAAAAYAALQGYDATPLCRVNTGVARLLKAASWGRPELVYSSSKSIGLLASEAGSRFRRCRVCGGYTSGGDVCWLCRRLGLG